jgi:DNA polymerase-3 subunit epsilon
MRQVFLDTETTGLSPEAGDRVIEIGCIEMVDRRLTGHDLHFYLNPDRRSHEDALKVHGLTDEFLADKPRFADVVDRLLEYVAGAELIAHNAAFDIAFLDAELKRAGRGAIGAHAAKITDSLVLAREAYPGKSNSLDALCRRLEVEASHRTLHGALLDAGLLAEVYIRMTRGQESLVIDPGGTSSSAQSTGTEPLVDLAGFTMLPVVVADDESVAHEAWLAELDKASNGKTVWRRMA